MKEFHLESSAHLLFTLVHPHWCFLPSLFQREISSGKTLFGSTLSVFRSILLVTCIIEALGAKALPLHPLRTSWKLPVHSTLHRGCSLHDRYKAQDGYYIAEVPFRWDKLGFLSEALCPKLPTLRVPAASGTTRFSSYSTVQNRWLHFASQLNSFFDQQKAVPATDSSKFFENDFYPFGKEIRKEFPILSQTVHDKPWIYFDNAATSQKPIAVIEKWKEYMQVYNSNIHRSAHYKSMVATEEYEAARDLLSNFLNASKREEIVFTSGATEGINLVAHSWGESNIQEGDEILISLAEHHSNFVPWQILAKKRKAKLKFIKIGKDGCVDMNHFKSLLSRRTKLVSVFHASNVLASISPIKEIVCLAHQFNAKVLVDACQSVPHMKVDVQAMSCDFLVLSGHKMCGPTSIGVLYGKYDLLNAMIPWKAGGEMIEEVTTQYSTYAALPYKFEAGTPPIAAAIALGAAVKFLNNLGMCNIERYEAQLSQYLYESLSSLPDLKIYGPTFEKPEKQRVNLASFNHPHLHANDVAAFLDYEGVAVRAGHHCAQPLHVETLNKAASVRASLYFYNTFEEVDSFIHKLKVIFKLLKNLENV